MTDLRQQLTRSVAEEVGMRLVSDMCDSLGLPKVFPEPEVLRADFAHIQAKSLARIIANLITENEPLLKAEADGTVIAVDERGGSGGFVVTVTPAVPARSLDDDLDPR